MHILANCPWGFYIVPTPTVKRLGIHLVQKSCIQQLSLICISLSLEIKAHNQGKENGCFQKWKGDNPLVATCLLSCILLHPLSSFCCSYSFWQQYRSKEVLFELLKTKPIFMKFSEHLVKKKFEPITYAFNIRF